MDVTKQITGTESNNFQDDILRSDTTTEIKCSEESLLPQIHPTTPLSSEALCEHCLKLDLEKALVKEDMELGNEFDSGRREYFNTWAVDVGRRYRVTRKTNCNLCQIFFASRVEDEDPASDGDGDGHVIRAVSLLWFSGLWESDDSPFLMLFPKTNYDLYKNYQRVKDRVQTSGCAALLQSNKPHTEFHPQQITSVFDWGTFEDWFGCCKRDHELLCSSIKTEMSGVRLIDCEEQSIAEYETGMSYVALSYVWGQPNPRTELYDRNQLPTSLSPLIRDAMAATQAMGFRYLWIDRYCIDQDDPVGVHHQIRQMGAIYGNAEVTIIAAAGKDESHGLPGVGTNRSTTVTVAHNSGVTVLWTLKNLRAVIKSSYWSTRGWTFQEAILSRRRLVFTEQQVYFECNTMNVFESCHVQLDSLDVKDKGRGYEGLRGGIFGGNRQAELDEFDFEEKSKTQVYNQYLSDVEEYSARKLTFATDSLNAFRGIAEQFWYRKSAVYNIWGLPYSGKPGQKEREDLLFQLTCYHKDNCPEVLRDFHRRLQLRCWPEPWQDRERERRDLLRHLIRYHTPNCTDLLRGPHRRPRLPSSAKPRERESRLLHSLIWYCITNRTHILRGPYCRPQFDSLAGPRERESRLLYSLTWYHTTSCWNLSRGPHRRPQLPSWSWAGWEGQVRYQIRLSQDSDLFDSLVGDISFESQTDNPTTLDMITPNPDETCAFPVMSITAVVIPFNLISFDFNTVWDKHWQIGKHKADLALSFGSASESRFAEDLKDSHTWKCVCIGAVRLTSFIMVLKLHECAQLWERAGMFIVECWPNDLTSLLQECEYGAFRVI